MTFRFEYMNLTQLGELFGVTSHEVGKWLVTLGLRVSGKQGLKPSPSAHDGGFVKDVPSRNQGYQWVWHVENTVKALEQAGHTLSIQPGCSLVAPSQLNGPFTLRHHPTIGHEVVNGDGTVAIYVTGEDNARFLTDLLNLANKTGVVRRLLGNRIDGYTAGPTMSKIVG